MSSAQFVILLAACLAWPQRAVLRRAEPLFGKQTYCAPSQYVALQRAFKLAECTTQRYVIDVGRWARVAQLSAQRDSRLSPTSMLHAAFVVLRSGALDFFSHKALDMIVVR